MGQVQRSSVEIERYKYYTVQVGAADMIDERFIAMRITCN
jgi:hypothetical protein